jgi:6-hydroxycyclohex-1-ene-1-carbonyl-CoA dehydrogenase
MTATGYRWLMTAPNTPMVREEFTLTPPAGGEVTVEIAGCGVCHTDLGFFYDGVLTKKDLPLALGHEISGRVVAAGAGAEGWLGKAVIIAAVIPCGQCDACSRGRPNICPHQQMPGNDIHGGFASHITVPARGLCEVDEARLAARDLPLANLAVVADAVTTPFQAVQRSGVGPGDLAIVIGAGGVGGYCVQIAAAAGASVVAIDVDDDKLAAIAGHGAALTLNARTNDAKALKKTIKQFAKESGARQTEWAIFECSGTGAGQQSAYSLLVHGATLCVVGFTMERIELRLSNLMAFDARALGNWGCPPELYPAALDLVLAGRIALLPFVEQMPLDDINEIFDAVHHRRIQRRVVLVPKS